MTQLKIGDVSYNDLADAFRRGDGVEVKAVRPATAGMHDDLRYLGQLLGELPVENSFGWGDELPTRRSVWLASRNDQSWFVTDEASVALFDGDVLAGERGRALLARTETHAPLSRLKGLADLALRRCARAVGLTPEYIADCTTRYRLIQYSGKTPGIGTHFDGNFLSAVLTNIPGLQEIRYDGSVVSVDHNQISVMPGSSLHRLTAHRDQPFLPTFHRVVSVPGVTASKVSLAAFFNLPDRKHITVYADNPGWYHDINRMKYDDNPGGTLSYLWGRVAQAHDVTVEALVNDQF